jgi:transposase
MSIFVLGVDLGKTFCSLVGLDEAGAVVLRRTIRRSGLMKTIEKLGPKVAAMEACCGAHFVGRHCQALGIEVRLMPSLYVKPYVKTNKSDDRDAEAIAEAATRPTMRFVPLKSQEQLDLQSVHRLRDRLVGERTGLINQLRAFLFERGISVPKKKASLAQYMNEVEAGVAPDGISDLVLSVLLDMWRDWQRLDERIAEAEAIIHKACRSDERMKQLLTVPGIGPLTASALVAAIGDGSAFGKGRDLSAWLGLVPRQSSTGGRTKMLGISKRGNVYLRKLFIHGARSVLRTSPAPLRPWLEGLRDRMHVNKVVTALANRLARIAWAILSSGQPFAVKQTRGAVAA